MTDKADELAQQTARLSAYSRENKVRAALSKHAKERLQREAVSTLSTQADDPKPAGVDVHHLPRLSDPVILALKPEGLPLRDGMVDLLRAHVYGPPEASYEALCRDAGVNHNTAWQWTSRYPLWNKWLACVMFAACSKSVTRVWRAVIARAEAGSDRAADMVLKRFDPGYAALTCAKYQGLKGPEVIDSVDPEVMSRAVELVESAQDGHSMDTKAQNEACEGTEGSDEVSAGLGGHDSEAGGGGVGGGGITT